MRLVVADTGPLNYLVLIDGRAMGVQTGYCKGKSGSIRIPDFGIGMLGANRVVAG